MPGANCAPSGSKLKLLMMLYPVGTLDGGSTGATDICVSGKRVESRTFVPLAILMAITPSSEEMLILFCRTPRLFTTQSPDISPLSHISIFNSTFSLVVGAGVEVDVAVDVGVGVGVAVGVGVDSDADVGVGVDVDVDVGVGADVGVGVGVGDGVGVGVGVGVGEGEDVGGGSSVNICI